MKQEARRRNWSLIALGAVAAIIVIFPWISPEYFTILLTRALILSIVALGLNILIGFTGIGHLGYAGFFALGAYTTGIMATRLEADFGLTFFSSIGIAAAATAIVAILLLRASGLYLLIISLAIAMCIWGLAYRWVSLTGGDNGITGIVRPHFEILGDMAVTSNFYYFILFFFVICLILTISIIKSPFGKTLIGIKESEDRMKVLGYNVWLHRFLALMISSVFAGLGGNLYAYYNTFVGTSFADLGTCMDFVLMVIIGGPGTIVGPFLGAIIIVLLKEVVSVYTTRWLLILGITYMLTALYAPEGVVGIWQRYFKNKKIGT